MVVNAAAPENKIGAGAGRAKRKNAGVNRRYSEEEYVSEDVEEESDVRHKRRRTSGDSSGVEAQVEAWLAKAPEGPISSPLVEAAKAYTGLNSKEFQALEALMEIERQSYLIDTTMGPALSQMADVAVATADGENGLDGLDSMELD